MQFLESLFEQAIAAAHPSVCLPPLLPEPPPSGRMILLAAGKAAGSMIEIAERHYLQGKRVPRERHRRHRGRASRLWPADASDRDDRSRPSGAGSSEPQFRRARARTRAVRDGRRSRAGADVGRRVGQLDRARARPCARGEAGGDACAAALRRQYRRDQHGAQTSLAHQGRTARAHAASRRGLSRSRSRTCRATIPTASDQGRPFPIAPTLADARAVVARFKLDLPESVHRALNDPANESPKPGDPVFATRAISSRRAAGRCVRGARRRPFAPPATNAFSSAPISKAKRARSRPSRRRSRRRLRARRPPRRDPVRRRTHRHDPRQGPRRPEPGICAGAGTRA